MESFAGAAYDALAAKLESAIPALAGRCAVDPQMNHLLRQPALAIFPASAQWDAQQVVERSAMDPNTVSRDVGVHATAMQLRLSWATRKQRQELEQAILSLFFGSATPGALVLPIHVEPFGDWMASFRIEDTLWEDDSATIPAEERHQSTLGVVADVPAVGLLGDAYPMGTIRLGVGDELDDDWPETDHFLVNSDGSLSPEGDAHGQ